MHHVEASGNQRVGFIGPFPCQAVHRESAAGKGHPDKCGGDSGPWQNEAEERPDRPRERRIEDKARFARVPRCSELPVGQDHTLSPLRTHFQPVEQMEFEVMSARRASNHYRQNGQESPGGNDKQRMAISHPLDATRAAGCPHEEKDQFRQLPTAVILAYYKCVCTGFPLYIRRRSPLVAASPAPCPEPTRVTRNPRPFGAIGN